MAGCQSANSWRTTVGVEKHASSRVTSSHRWCQCGLQEHAHLYSALCTYVPVLLMPSSFTMFECSQSQRDRVATNIFMLRLRLNTHSYVLPRRLQLSPPNPELPSTFCTISSNLFLLLFLLLFFSVRDYFGNRCFLIYFHFLFLTSLSFVLS